jgi:hypothetical protein
MHFGLSKMVTIDAERVDGTSALSKTKVPGKMLLENKGSIFAPRHGWQDTFQWSRSKLTGYRCFPTLLSQQIIIMKIFYYVLFRMSELFRIGSGVQLSIAHHRGKVTAFSSGLTSHLAAWANISSSHLYKTFVKPIAGT